MNNLLSNQEEKAKGEELGPYLAVLMKQRVWIIKFLTLPSKIILYHLL